MVHRKNEQEYSGKSAAHISEKEAIETMLDLAVYDHDEGEVNNALTRERVENVLKERFEIEIEPKI